VTMMHVSHRLWAASLSAAAAWPVVDSLDSGQEGGLEGGAEGKGGQLEAWGTQTLPVCAMH
jgi:hypothetical protein